MVQGRKRVVLLCSCVVKRAKLRYMGRTGTSVEELNRAGSISILSRALLNTVITPLTGTLFRFYLSVKQVRAGRHTTTPQPCVALLAATGPRPELSSNRAASKGGFTMRPYEDPYEFVDNALSVISL